MHPFDTIVAISTPPGRGGIGIVRLSRPESLRIALALLASTQTLIPRHATLAKILGAAGETLDEAIATYFPAPNSYTTEDIVEIAAHSAPVLLNSLLEAAVQQGARLANPGEFTQRAFLAGRIDLTQAEAVHDLIAAQTLHQARTAAAQLGGSIAQTIAPIKQRLTHLIAALEAGVDFAEDDLDLVPDSQILTRLQSLAQSLATLAETAAYGRILRDGIRLAIVGRPNAGKSSLFNALLRSERAIVTAQPGTTRDPITERLAIHGIPVELIDTAGLRTLPDTPEAEPERLGIARSRTAIADAHLILHVLDATNPTPEDETLALSLAPHPTLTLLNKIDLIPTPPAFSTGIPISTLTGQGIETLRLAIASHLAAAPPPESPILTNLRQSQAVAEAHAAILRAITAARTHTPHEFLLLDLHEALHALDTLTGATTPDDLLNLIFSTFCVGK